MTQAVLLTGGNLGPVAETLALARRMLIERVGPEWGRSGVRESEPWGFDAPQRFLNQVLVLETELEPLALLDTIQQIERELGRVRETENAGLRKTGSGLAAEPDGSQALRHYHSRPIDIDILFYGNRIIDMPRLRVPHPLMGQRAFVLRPLAEVLPGYVHPVTGLTVREMLERLG